MKITIFEIIKMIKDGKLKDGTKIRCSDFPATYVYKNGTLGFYGAEEFIELTLRDILENINYANYEILEEEKKIPEKLDVIAYEKCIHEVTHKEKQLALEIRETQIAFNEIIDYLKSKGDE